MSFFSSRGRAAPGPPSRAPAIAIGQHVFVDSAGNRSGSVELADVSGKILSAVRLADGAEVEVVAWRPRGGNETRYRIRAAHGVDGWLPAENLRHAFIAVAAPPPTSTPATVPSGGGRRFGNRTYAASRVAPPSVADESAPRFGSHTHAGPTAAAPTPAPAPASVAGDDERRFGNRVYAGPAGASATVASDAERRFGNRSYAGPSAGPAPRTPQPGGRRFGQH